MNETPQQIREAVGRNEFYELRHRPTSSATPCRNSAAPWSGLHQCIWRLPLLAFIFLAISATASAQTNAPDWSSFRGNAQSTGNATSDGVQTSDALEPVWEFKLDDGGFESAAAIVQTGVDEKTVFIAGLTNDVKGKLFALNLADGKKRWEFNTPDGFLTTPLYHDGHLFLGDMAGMFYCVDPAGQEEMEFQNRN